MPARQSGTWPRQRAGGWRMQVARAAVNVDAHDSGARRQRRVARRKGWPENRQHRRADRSGQMHRSGVAGDEQRQSFEDRREHNEIGLDRQLDERNVDRPCGANSSSTGLSAVEPTSTTDASRVRAISAPTSANRIGIPFLDSASGRRLDADQRRAILRRANELGGPAPRLVGDVQTGRAARLRRGYGASSLRYRNARSTSAFALSAMCARGSGATAIGQERTTAAGHESNAALCPRHCQQQLLRMSGSKLIARSYSLQPPRPRAPREARATTARARHVPSTARRAFQRKSTPGMSRAKRTIPASDDEVDRAHRAPALLPSQSTRAPSTGRRHARAASAECVAARCRRPGEARRGHPKSLATTKGGICQPDEHALLPIRNLKVFEHYRISARSIMTPSARVSDPPRIVRGIHVEL